MKRVLTLILLTILGTTLTIQAQHLKFMGIPLDGTITNFQAKLAQKGFTPNVVTNKTIGVGCRAFKGGTFSGEKAEIYVYYNPKTKIVYRAKAVISRSNENHINTLYNRFKKSIGDKYKSRSEFESSYQDGHASGTYYIWQDDIELIGCISLYVSTPVSYLDDRYLHIDYEDSINTKKNDRTNSDDL